MTRWVGGHGGGDRDGQSWGVGLQSADKGGWGGGECGGYSVMGRGEGNRAHAKLLVTCLVDSGKSASKLATSRLVPCRCKRPNCDKYCELVGQMPLDYKTKPGSK